MSSTCVVVTGIPGSGLSVVADLLVELGLELDRSPTLAGLIRSPVVADDDERVWGREMAGLHQRALQAAVPVEPNGMPEWGWVPSERFDRSVFVTFDREAENLIATRSRDRTWGWADARTSLLLDFWQQRVKHARYILLYRPPWDVMGWLAEEAARADRPYIEDSAVLLWCWYARHLLEFFDKHADSCLLIEAPGIFDDPERAVTLLTERLRLEPSEAALTAALPAEPTAVAQVLVGRTLRPGHPRRRADEEPVHKLLDMTPFEARMLLSELDRRASIRSQRRDATVAGLVPFPPLKKPRVSVIVPQFNAGRVVLDALASVRCWGRDDVEVVVVDDGSDDPWAVNLTATIEEMGVRVLRQDHRGASAARNAGLAATSAPYVLPLDADDLIRPMFFTSAMEVLESDADVAVVYGDAMRCGDERGRWAVGEFDVDRLATGNYIHHCALIRRTALVQRGGWDEGLTALEDWDLWLDLAREEWKFHYIPDVAFDYRQQTGSLVAITQEPQSRRPLVSRIIEKNADLYHDHLAPVINDFWDALEAVTVALESAEDQRNHHRYHVETAERELAELRPLRDEIVALRQQVTQQARTGRVLEDMLAETRSELMRSRVAAQAGHEYAAHAAAAHLGAQKDAAAVRQELQALYATRTMRFLRIPRGIYGFLRRRS